MVTRLGAHSQGADQLPRVIAARMAYRLFSTNSLANPSHIFQLTKTFGHEAKKDEACETPWMQLPAGSKLRQPTVREPFLCTSPQCNHTTLGPQTPRPQQHPARSAAPAHFCGQGVVHARGEPRRPPSTALPLAWICVLWSQ